MVSVVIRGRRPLSLGLEFSQAIRLLWFLLLMALPTVTKAQFTYTNTDGIWSFTTNNSYLTITGFSGSGNATVPSSITFRWNGHGILLTWPVTCIGDGAFSAFLGSPVDAPTSVTISDSVTNIGNYVFEEAINLTNLVIGAGVASIGINGFQWTYALQAITVNSTNASYSSSGGVLFNKSQTTLIQYPTGNPTPNYTIPNGVTNIGDLAFWLSFNLTNVTIPPSVISIGNQAFASGSVLNSVCFTGNSPSVTNDLSVFADDNNVVYYLPTTTGWGSLFDGRPTAKWIPEIQNNGVSFGVQTNQFGFNINWANDQTVVVDACTDLANPDWQPVQTNTLTTGSAYFSDPQWTNYPSRYYRLRSQ